MSPPMHIQARVRGIVHKAVKDGTLRRRPCEVCGVSRVEAHHEDYDRPLDVRWLCRLHHSWRHKYGETIEEMRAEALAARAERDAEFQRLLVNLTEHWATLSADNDGEELAASYLRAAYGAGYVRALEGGTA